VYRDSPERLRQMDYCNGIEGFINYALSNPRNISGCNIRCLCKRCKNKKVSQSRCCNEVSSIKRVYEENLCWFAHVELYVPYKIIIERMVRSTYSSSNVHGVIYDNSNSYRNMVMNATKINQ
jgi:hypothetical protein